MRYATIGDGRVDLTVSQLCLGTMFFGYRTDEDTSFAILDRFLEAGGTFLDTANNYGQWHGEAGESERLLGRWMKSRGVTDRMVVATKVGARTLKPGDPSPEHWQGLGARWIREDSELSLRQLGVDRLDLYYAHIDDRVTAQEELDPYFARTNHRGTPQEETVAALAELAESGKVGLLGVSNHATWRIARARAIAQATGRPAYSVVQQMHSYLRPRPEGGLNQITEELVDYATTENLTLLAYSPLLGGFYARGGPGQERGNFAQYDHPSNREQLSVLRKVADEVGATLNQVVLAWMVQSRPSIIPVTGASSVAQLDDQLGAFELQLDDEHLKRLDAARVTPEA